MQQPAQRDQTDPAPEELDFGPAPLPLRRLLPFAVVVLVLLALGLVGTVGWRVYRASSPEFTLNDLNNSYAAFTTSSGTNEVSILTRDKFTEPPVEVGPERCSPLFQSTMATQFPSRALDGVLVYSIGSDQGGSMSLYTFRYTNARLARADYDQVTTALPQCRQVTVAMQDQQPRRMAVAPVEVTRDSGVRSQTAYLITRPDVSGRFSVHVLQFGNTVTWEYRYVSGSGEYSHQQAQELMDALVAQMRDVLSIRS
ncbi:hypothetical protein GCM10009841_25080 [Microlunatus panaciterrae]|uniref:PknH-like extracellular domain-containing protein n=1 Tax=Microlunatus panaciterrae TaxID=400768 RepID=A0ABS2RHH5_9ACTN|nr:hypothetical protein [Microlunatus panaciterrae]MBM7797389.1 hypothetical protein [Microlunatus panaciterrae]